ncbi:MAG: Xaa-Pro dipeptidase [Acidobacteria bacterium]|nr:MAG: Xaa-Pro dipeptidase [Acidobacteriota bacterium]REK07953.1 MAG: Xaa-Pro dipeptidase [Acidobacteriota bacterium]
MRPSDHDHLRPTRRPGHPAGRPLLPALLILLSTVPLAATVARGEGLALVGGRLIDGFGGEPLENSVVLIEGERIAAVGQVGQLAVPEGWEVVSTEGMSVLPGLWEMHAHLMLVGHSDYDHWDSTYPDRFGSVIMPAAAEQLLRAGVTSARDLGAPLAESIQVRDAINAGELPGPTMYVSGPFLQKEPYPGTEAFRWGVDGPEDARAKVRRLADAGVDLIKMIDQDQMTMDEVRAIVDEAHARGLQVIGHSHRPEEIRRGIEVGVDCFEHTGLGTMPEYPADVFELMKSRADKLFWTPTLTPLYLYEYTRDNPERIDDPRWRRGLPDEIAEDVRRSLDHLERLDYYQLIPKRRPTLKRKFEQLRESGVVLLIGTDSGVPLTFHSDSTWREMDLWVREHGMDPMAVIQAATYWPAVAQRVIDDFGTVSEGKYADVIAVRGDVLREINLLQDVDLVVKKGRRIR